MKKMDKTAKAYIDRCSEHCRTFSNEGKYGYLENVLFQLKRKEQKMKERLATIGKEITGIEELIMDVSAKIDCEAEKESAGPTVNK